MGNQLIKNYDINKEPVYYGGFQKLWKLFEGKKQDKSKQKVSIFQFDKKQIDKSQKNKEEILQILRKEVQILMRFKHPNCLSVLEPLLEDNNCIAFVTENFEYPLSYLISSNLINQFYSSELELKIHIIELIQVLSFFHNDVKTVHLGVCPQNIFVTKDGKWKLGGMNFSQTIIDNKQIKLTIDQSKQKIQINPDVNFSAPEINDKIAYFQSDIYSLGALILGILKMNTLKNCQQIFVKEDINNINQYLVEQPLAFRQLIQKMMSQNPLQRPSIQEIGQNIYFNDPYIQTIKLLDTIFELDQSQQANLLKGLQQTVLKFDIKIIKNRIIPNLIKCLKLETLSHSVVQTILLILENEDCSNQIDFINEIYPSLKQLITGKEMSAQALFFIIQKIEVIQNKLSSSETTETLLPLFLKSFECGVPKLQILALQKTHVFIRKLEYVQMKNMVLPRILNLCSEGQIDIRKQGLVTLNKIYEIFDKNIISEQILLTLEKIRKQGTDKQINLLVLQIFEGIAKLVDLDVIANKMLPSIIPYLAEKNMSKQEFMSYLKITKQLLQQIENDKKFQDQEQEEIIDIDLLESDLLKENKQQIKENLDFDFLNELNQQSPVKQQNLFNIQQDFQFMPDKNYEQNQVRQNQEEKKNQYNFLENVRNKKQLNIQKEDFTDFQNNLQLPDNTSKFSASDFEFPTTIRKIPETFVPFSIEQNKPMPFQNQIIQNINMASNKQNQNNNPWEQDLDLDDAIFKSMIGNQSNMYKSTVNQPQNMDFFTSQNIKQEKIQDFDFFNEPQQKKSNLKQLIITKQKNLQKQEDLI